VSIRFKVVIPYLLLTLVVAVLGVYVVTKLVSGSLSERLKNQLFEAGRVVSDTFARQEKQHIEDARLIAYTVGLAQSLRAGDHASLDRLARPVASAKGIENLVIIDENGQEQLHLLQQADGIFQEVSAPTGFGGVEMIQTLLLDNPAQTLPRRAFGVNPINNRYYYYTAVIVPLEGKVAGVVMVGTSIDTILSTLKSTSLADVILYAESSQPIASTLAGQTNNPAELALLSLTQNYYLEIQSSSKIIYGETLFFGGRTYSIARGPLTVGNDRLGVFGVALPADFAVEAGSTSRNTYVFCLQLWPWWLCYWAIEFPV